MCVTRKLDGCLVVTDFEIENTEEGGNLELEDL